MNEKQELECQLNCKATASLEASVSIDLNKKDKNLEELLNERESDDKEKTGDSKNSTK